MARGRFISNSISTSKKFARLANDRHRLAYLMLVPHVDAEGRHDADLRILAGQVYTLLDLTHEQIQEAMTDLDRVGLIHLYAVEGEAYLEVVNFHEHNKVRRSSDGLPSHEAPSTIPAPSGYEHKPVTATEPLQSDYVATTAEVEVKVQVQDKVQVQEPRAHAREAGALKNHETGKTKKPPPPKLGDFDPHHITLPEFLDPDAWQRFVDHREELGKPLTEAGTRGILELLAKHPGNADAMLRQTCEAGWTRVFPLDKPRDRPNTNSAADAWEQILASARNGQMPNLDPPGKAALKAIGGWAAVAYGDERGLGLLRKRFLDAYQTKEVSHGTTKHPDEPDTSTRA